MSLLSKRAETRSEWGSAAIPTNGSIGNRHSAGRLVNAVTANQLSTVFACKRLIGETIATFPWKVYRQTDTLMVPESKSPLIVSSPSTEVTAIGWRRQVLDALVTRGNVWGLVTGVDSAGRPTGINIVNNDLIGVYRSGSSGPFTFTYCGRPIRLFEDGGDLWHKAANEQPGTILGLSVLEAAATAIGLGLAAEGFGADWFGQDATPQGLISYKRPLNDNDGTKSKTIKERFKAAARSRDVVVMGDDLTYTQIQVAANESQFLATIQANKPTICDYFGVQAEMVNGSSGSSLTYANVEQRLLHLLILCLQPWTVRLEAIYDELTARPFIVRADFDALLRPDHATKANVDIAYLRAGVYSPNRVLTGMNEPGYDGGDAHNWPPYNVKNEVTEPGSEPLPVPPAVSPTGA